MTWYRWAALGILAGLVPMLSAGCRSEDPPVKEPSPAGPPWFRDVTAEVGIDFVHDAGPVGNFFMPQNMGSGAAVFDFDNDGRLDIYLVQNGGPNSAHRNRLYHQEPDGHFTDVSAGSGLDVAGYGMGVAIGDVNNDGLPDVLLTEYGRVRLFLNQGGGKFRDVTREACLDNPFWGTSASFLDYDRDGWLDLVIVNYVDYDASVACTNAAGRRDFCHPSTFPPTVTKLFRNLGKPGMHGGAVRFEDVTVKSGLARTPGPGLGVICADFNGDHWPDIFVANDSQPNRLWINQHDGTFREEAFLRGVAVNRMGQPEANMGVALGDVDGDGLLDLLVTHLTEETHTLWRQGPRGVFRDETVEAGLTHPLYRGTGFGTVLADFDQDGAVDLAVANGRVYQKKSGPPPSLEHFWDSYAEPNQLFANDGKGRFRDLARDNPDFCGRTAVWRGLVCADLDNDGSLDLLATAIAAPARVYRNVAPNRGHWLQVRAIDPALHRDAYGAEIIVRAGDRRWVRLVNPGSSYLCSIDPRAHFGLGPVDRVDEIRVTWPDGREEIFPGQPADRHVTLQRGRGKVVGGG